MRNRSALKLSEEEINFLHNKDGLTKLEQKSLSLFPTKKNKTKSKKNKK